MRQPIHAAEIKRGRWWPVFLGVVLMPIGLAFAASGASLFISGLSWYYLPAGLGLLLTGYFLFKRDSFAFWTYLVTYLMTLAWALWETGIQSWAETEQLIAPTVILALVLTTLPFLNGKIMRVRTGVVATVVTLFGMVSVLSVGGQSMGAIVSLEPATETLFR